MNNSRCTRNWSDLPEDLLVLIVRKIRSFRVLCAFEAVCVSWRSIAKDFNVIRHRPWLLQAKNQVGDAADGKKTLVVSDDNDPDSEFIKIVMLRKNIPTYSLGWKGWVLSVDKYGNMKLLHILSQNILATQLKLPRKGTLQGHRVITERAAVSSDPSTLPSDSILVLIYGDYLKLAFWSPGDKSYTKTQFRGIHDVIFHDGLCYVLVSDRTEYSYEYEVRMLADVTAPDPNAYKVIGRIPQQSSVAYLVGSGEDLFITTRCFFLTKNYTTHQKLNVYHRKLDRNDGFEEINDLGKRAIFVGINTSFLVEDASEIGCKPNHIFFTENMCRTLSGYAWN